MKDRMRWEKRMIETDAMRSSTAWWDGRRILPPRTWTNFRNFPESQRPALLPYPAGELCHGRDQSDQGEAEVAVDEGRGVLTDLDQRISHHQFCTVRLGGQTYYHHITIPSGLQQFQEALGNILGPERFAETLWPCQCVHSRHYSLFSLQCLSWKANII